MTAGGRGGFGGQTVSSRDIAQFREILEMGDEQSELVDMLYEGFREQNQTINEEMRAAFQAAREEAEDGGGWEGMRERMEAFQQKREKVEKTFMADFKSILTVEQLEKWPKVERAHNRSRHLNRGFVRGERVDLIQVVDDLDLDSAAREEVGVLLEAYEIELDRALMKRVDQYSEGFAEWRELRESGDMEGIEKLMQKGREASLRVKEVNDKFARQISGALNEEYKMAFTGAVNLAVYPDVYRSRHAKLAIDAARQFEDLSEDQAARIDGLGETYARRDTAVNAKLVKSLEEQEENMSFQDFMRRGRGGNDEADELWREKRTLSRDTVEKLREILDDDQIERLPEEPREDRQRRGGQRGQRGRQIS